MVLRQPPKLLAEVRFLQSMPIMKKYIPTEHEECVAFVDFLTRKGLKFSHLAQSTYTASWAAKVRNQKLGVVAGVPDYIVITPHGLLFIEMKRTAGSVTRKEQKDWISSLNALSGVEARVCFGAEDAIKFVEEFL